MCVGSGRSRARGTLLLLQSVAMSASPRQAVWSLRAGLDHDSAFYVPSAQLGSGPEQVSGGAKKTSVGSSDPSCSCNLPLRPALNPEFVASSCHGEN